jgi:mono/diheme cytochrome c family protein
VADAEGVPGLPVGGLNGQGVFNAWCYSCHGPGNRVGTNALRARYAGSVPDALQARQDLKPDFVRYIVRNGISFMPFFRQTEISERELDAMENYLSHTPGAAEERPTVPPNP